MRRFPPLDDPPGDERQTNIRVMTAMVVVRFGVILLIAAAVFLLLRYKGCSAGGRSNTLPSQRAAELSSLSGGDCYVS